MVFLKKHRRKALLIAAFLMALLVFSGCEPYKPRDYREEGLKKGLLTGEEGEFVIYRRFEEPKKKDEDKKSQDEDENAEKQEEKSDQSGNIKGQP